jgi:hypothetical protein
MYWKKPPPQREQRLTASTKDDNAGEPAGSMRIVRCSRMSK